METTDSGVPVGYCAVCKCRTMADSKGLALDHTLSPVSLDERGAATYTGGARVPCPGAGVKVTGLKRV